MSAAVALRDVVGEAQHRLVIAVVPPQGTFDGYAVALAADGDRLGDEPVLGAVEPDDEGFDAADIMHGLLARLDTAQIGERDRDAGIEVGELAQAMLEGRIVELDPGEGLRRGKKGHFGTLAAAGIADDAQRRVGVAIGEAHEVLFAIAEDPELQLRGQGIDDRHADPMQAARDLVGVLVEFAAGMKLGHDDLGGRNSLARVDVGGDAAAIVADGAGAIGIERDGDAVGMADQRLVDGIVHHLVDHVMETGAVIGVADIHAGALAHGIEAFQDLDRVGAIFGARRDGGGAFCHSIGHG